MTMTSDEVWDLLELIASIDRRKVGLTDRQVWEGLVGDLSAADAQAAVIAYYRESREWIMPADVRTRVKAMRRERLERAIVPAPAAGLADNPGNHLAALRDGIRQLADGKQVRLAIAPPVREGPPPADFTEARKALGPALEKRDPGPLGLQERARQQAAASRAEREARESPADPEPGEVA